MKRTALKIIAGLGLLAMIPTAAMAHTDVSVGVNLGGGYYQPGPSYAAPAYYGQPVAVRSDYRDQRDWDRREWEHRQWEHRHWDNGYDRHHERDWHHDHDRRW